VSHGENQDGKDLVADLVDHAIVTHTDSERVKTRKLHRPGGARVARKRENPRLETLLNRSGELSELSGRVRRELDPVSV
jgi:hypothetical protein